MNYRFLLLAFMIVFSACSSAPGDKIVGTWKYETVLFKNPNDPTAALAKDLMNTMCSDLIYRFESDGTYETFRTIGDDPESGTYRFENRGTVIVLQSSVGLQSRWIIREFTRSTLIYEDGTVDGMAVQLKKE